MIYWMVFLLSLFVLFVYSRVDYTKSTFCKFYVFIIIALGVFRDTTIGTDIMLSGGGHYYALWKSPLSGLTHSEYGFLVLTSYLKTLVNSYYFYYGSIFAMTMGMYFFAAKKFGINPAIFFSIFFISSTITSSYNIIRQIFTLSACVLVFSYFLYDVNFETGKNARISYFKIAIYEMLIMLLAIGFHTSTIILVLLPLFHISYIQKFLSRDAVLWILLVLVVIVNFRYSDQIQEYVIMANSVLGLGERADFWAEVVENYGENINSSHGIGTTIIFGSIAILASRGKRNLLFFIGFIGLLLSNLASVSLGTVGRVFNNLSIFLIFYYAQIFGELLNSYTIYKTDFRWAIVMLFIITWTYNFYIMTIMSPSISPYKTYLF